MLAKVLVVLALAVLALAAPRSLLAQSGGMCVLNTPPGYQNMGGAAQLGPLDCNSCQESVRTQFQGNPQATCSKVSSGATTGGGAGGSAGYDWRMDLTQTAITSFWDGMRRGREMARQRALAEEQQNRARIQAARERVRQREIELSAAREEDRRQRETAFQSAKNDLARELRGLAPPDASSTALRRNDGGAPASGLKRAGLFGQPAGLRRLYCSAAVARLAAEAALARREEESVFLAQQSQSAYTGQRLDVECPAGPAVPEIGPIKCTVRENGRDIDVPCDEEPLRGFYPELLDATVEEINRLAAIQERFPDLQRAKVEAANNLREKKVAHDRARAEESRRPPPGPIPAPTPPRPKSCASELCREAERERQEAEKLLAEVDDAASEESTARTALRRNTVILREVETNPGAVSRMLSKVQQPRGRRP